MAVLAQRVLLLALTTSAVLLPLLLLAPRIQRRYQAKTCYYLWLLLAVRLLVPVELALPGTPVIIQAPTYAVTVPAPAPAQAPAGAQAHRQSVTEAVPSRQVPVWDLFTAVWLAGAAGFLLWNMAGYCLARRRLLAGSYCSEADALIADGLRRELGLDREVPVRRTAAGTPMTLGLLRPQVLLPEDLTDEAETQLILRHELCHVGRRDLWYKGLFLLVNAVYWFDPLVWLMCREAGRNLEYCCDDAVVEGRDGDFRYRYGRVLLGRAEAAGGVPVLSNRFAGGTGQMKGRLMNLFEQKRRGRAMVCLVLGAVLLAGGVAVCESADALEGAAPISTPAPDVAAGNDMIAQAPDQAEQLRLTGDTAWQWPVSETYEISSRFGRRIHPLTGRTISHDGTDIAAPEGTAVQAAAAGTVEAAGYDQQDGNYVLLTHGGGAQTYYAALKDLSVKAGDKVAQGQAVGQVGSTGASTGPHLHFEVRQDGAAVDPSGQYPSLAEK